MGLKRYRGVQSVAKMVRYSLRQLHTPLPKGPRRLLLICSGSPFSQIDKDQSPVFRMTPLGGTNEYSRK